MQARSIYIEYRRRRGLQLRYTLKRTTTVSENASGLLSKLLGRNKQNTEERELVLEQNTADVMPDWIAVVKTTVESASRTVDGKPTAFPREEDPTAAYVQQKVDRFGNALESSGDGETLDGGVYPDQALRIGDTWEAPLVITVPKFNELGQPVGTESLTVTRRFQLLDLQEIAKLDCAIVEMRYEHQRYVNPQLLHRITQHTTYTFAHREGFLVKSEGEHVSALLSEKKSRSTTIRDTVQMTQQAVEGTVGGMRL